MDFYQNRDTGQLWLEDRQWLFETVRALKPVVAVETGTWKGGGSTFFIASALYYNEAGILVTVESDKEMYNHAVALYDRRWPFLKKHVVFHHGDSELLLPQIVPSTIDFVFLDGAQDTTKSLREFEFLAPKLRVGGVLMAHDWFNEKQDKVKPFLENNPNWKLETIGTGDGTFEKGSVGMAKATKLK